MPKAIWNGAVLAESDQTEVVVEGNHYLRLTTINKEYFQSSQTHDMPVERAASYYSIGGRWAG